MGIGIFWGVILIVIGVSIVFKVVFDVSIFRIIIACAFILIGIKILIGKSAINISSNDSDVIFNDRRYTDFPTTSTEYNTIFGKSVFDFSNAAVPTDKQINLEFNTIFGNSEIYLPPGLPVRIKAEAIFGSAQLPNDNTAVFGSANYVSEHDSAITSFINIEANAIFGHVEIIQKVYK
jgi:predicted membrane protein